MLKCRLHYLSMFNFFQRLFLHAQRTNFSKFKLFRAMLEKYLTGFSLDISLKGLYVEFSSMLNLMVG